jgi:hypothetical protein
MDTRGRNFVNSTCLWFTTLLGDNFWQQAYIATNHHW